MSEFRILVPHNLPSDQHAEFAANAIRSVEERESKRRADEEARMARAAAIKASLEAVAIENKARDERKAEAARKRDAASFDESLRQAFFEASPMASESDWNRAKADIRAAALKERALDQFRGRETLVDRNVAILRKSGRYGSL